MSDITSKLKQVLTTKEALSGVIQTEGFNVPLKFAEYPTVLQNALDKRPAITPLLSFIWSDYKLNDMRWLQSDGKYHKEMYSLIYDHLSGDYTSGESCSEIVSSATTTATWTVNYILSTDGHKICSSSMKDTLDNIYNENGVAWYYVFDEEKGFILPRTKYGFQGIKGSNAVGTYDQPGLPNITGVVNAGDYWIDSATGAFKKANTNNSEQIGTTSNGKTDDFTFDASRSNAIYGASTTVQPPATEMYLYFYVGQYKRDEIYNAACLNKSYVDEKISESKGYAFPDYSNVQTIKASGVAYDENGYSAPDNGWFLVNYVDKDNTDTVINIFINGTYHVGYFYMAHGYWSTTAPCGVSVSKGDKITLVRADKTDNRSNHTIYFIPHK